LKKNGTPRKSRLEVKKSAARPTPGTTFSRNVRADGGFEIKTSIRRHKIATFVI